MVHAPADVPISPASLGLARLPAHVAIIMDGNGRWATSRGMTRIHGHREGARSVRRVVTLAYRLGIRHLTLYAFSAQNWSRPPAEIAGLMALFLRYVKAERALILRREIRFRVLGDRSALPARVVAAIEELEGLTRRHTAMDLSIALSYGGREEILQAARALAVQVARGALDPANITEERFSSALYTKGIPDPDLLIRTSGEMRISNFLLWQIAYAELYVTPTLWPDFGDAAFIQALRSYGDRERRFGKTGAQVAPAAHVREGSGDAMEPQRLV